MRIAVLLFIFFITLFSNALSKAQNGLPIVVEAQKLKYDDTKKVAVYIGNVIAQHGKTIMTGDKLIIRFDKTGRYVTKIEVIGNVHIKDEKGEGWCNKLYYYPAQEKVVLEGNAKLKQGKNVVIGDRIVAYRDGRVSVEGIKQKVKTVIYPEERSGETKRFKPPESR